ncbi:MAG: DinB family protein [Anaerolineaceae bacterium]|nr:DinB family protein [Anaerolineaceae bacterium]
MSDKKQILDLLQDEFNRWEGLLASMSGEQLTARLAPSVWSVKDNLAHLMVWQQRSIARLQAAALNHPPQFPGWPETLDPESDEDLDAVNAWIYETNRDRPWQSVYPDWRAGFMRFIELGQAVPEDDLLDARKYAWMDGYSLARVLEASCGHHQEHREALQAWLSQHGGLKTGG